MSTSQGHEYLPNWYLISILNLFSSIENLVSHFEGNFAQCDTNAQTSGNPHCWSCYILFPLFLRSRNSYFLHGCMHNYLPTSLLHLNMKWKRWSCWWGGSEKRRKPSEAAAAKNVSTFQLCCCHEQYLLKQTEKECQMMA